MGLTKPKTQAIKGLDNLDNVKSKKSDLLRSTLDFIDNKLFRPLEITVNAGLITITGSEILITESNDMGSLNSTYSVGIPPINRQYNVVQGATLELATGIMTGNLEETTSGLAPTPPIMVSGAEVCLGFEVLHTGTIRAVWSDVDTTAKPNTIAWTKGSLKRGFITLECAESGSSWSPTRFVTAVNGDITCFDSYTIGEDIGDPSFSIHSITGNTLIINRGDMLLNNGSILVTGAGTTSKTVRVDDPIDLTLIRGGTATPIGATLYHLYLDLQVVRSAGLYMLEDTNEYVYRAATADMYYLTLSDPLVINSDRFVYIGWILPASSGNTWTGIGASFGSAPKCKHTIPKIDTSENYIVNPDFECDLIGEQARGVTGSAAATVVNGLGEVLYGTRSLKLVGGNDIDNLRGWTFDLYSFSNFDLSGQRLALTLVTRTASPAGSFVIGFYNTTLNEPVAPTLTNVPTGDGTLSIAFVPLVGNDYILYITETMPTSEAIYIDKMKLTRESAAQSGVARKGGEQVRVNSDFYSIVHNLAAVPQLITASFYDGAMVERSVIEPSNIVVTYDDEMVAVNTMDFDFTNPASYLEVTAFILVP